MSPEPLLLLWDIDGTLLQRASVAHARALHEAVTAVHGVDVSGVTGVAAAGRTDGAIARDLLRAVGVDDGAIDAGFDEVVRICGERYAPGDLSAHVVDGMPALLATLGDGFRHSLVTGNFEAIAHAKLDAAGIGAHFARGQGGFGSDAEDRSSLPPIARRRAGDHPGEQTIVIGDTPNDIACARADGVRVIAVTTGPFGADALRGADAVASGPAELEPLLRALV